MFSVAVLTLRSSLDPSLRLLAAGRLGMTISLSAGTGRSGAGPRRVSDVTSEFSAG